MKEKNSIKNSMFYKKNMKIQSNLWKAYTIALIASLMVIFVKGIS